MSLLLDSHALLWAMDDSDRLGAQARAALATERDEIAISAATIWELGIKRARGGLVLPDDFVAKVVEAGFRILVAAPSLCWKAAHLPPHHGDPFDRLIIAQALEASMTIMTSDAIFPRYGVKVVSASR